MNQLQEAVLADGMLDIRLRALKGTVERAQANLISLLADRDEVADHLANAKTELFVTQAAAKSFRHALPGPGRAAAPMSASAHEEDWTKLEQMVEHFVSGQQEQDDMVAQSFEGERDVRSQHPRALGLHLQIGSKVASRLTLYSLDVLILHTQPQDSSADDAVPSLNFNFVPCIVTSHIPARAGPSRPARPARPPFTAALHRRPPQS